MKLKIKELNPQGFAVLELVAAVLVVGVIASVGTYVVTRSHAQSPKATTTPTTTSGSVSKTVGACSLTISSDDHLIATGSGLKGNTQYYSQVKTVLTQSIGTQTEASVYAGQWITKADGSFSYTEPYTVTWGMTRYKPDVYTTLTFNVYPMRNNKADINTIVAKCSITP